MGLAAPGRKSPASQSQHLGEFQVFQWLRQLGLAHLDEDLPLLEPIKLAAHSLEREGLSRLHLAGSPLDGFPEGDELFCRATEDPNFGESLGRQPPLISGLDLALGLTVLPRGKQRDDVIEKTDPSLTSASLHTFLRMLQLLQFVFGQTGNLLDPERRGPLEYLPRFLVLTLGGQ